MIRSQIKKKLLCLLAGGIALGISKNTKTQKFVLKSIHKDLREINKKYLYKLVNEFKNERLLEYVEERDGAIKIILTEKGKQIVLKFDIDKIKIKKPIKWDRKWRVVFFDIPESRRVERNILRNKLKELGFGEIQKSVFVHPFPCLDEINFITEYFQLRNLVRYGEMINISNEEEFKLKFGLY